jgi:hypothetical protein
MDWPARSDVQFLRSFEHMSQPIGDDVSRAIQGRLKRLGDAGLIRFVHARRGLEIRYVVLTGEGHRTLRSRASVRSPADCAAMACVDHRQGAGAAAMA